MLNIPFTLNPTWVKSYLNYLCPFCVSWSKCVAMIISTCSALEFDIHPCTTIFEANLCVFWSVIM